MAPQDKYIVIGGHRHRYVEAGQQGPPMLLVHGISSSLDFFGPSIQLLARSFRVLGIDLLGFGGSDKPANKEYSLRLYADLIREFAEKTEAFGNGPLYATGHSMGGKYLLATALLHEGIFDKIVLSNTDGFLTLPSFARGLSLPGVRHVLKRIVTRPDVAEKMLSAAFHSTGNIPEETWKKILEIAVDDGAFETVMSLNRNLLKLDMQRTGLRSRLGELKVPALIIWGDQDKYMSPKIAHVVKRELPCSKLLMLRNCGHSPMLEYPELFSTAITEFILNDQPSNDSSCS